MQIFDAKRKVKFEAFKYDLQELFERTPAFDAPIPSYQRIEDLPPDPLAAPSGKPAEKLTKKEIDVWLVQILHVLKIIIVLLNPKYHFRMWYLKIVIK